jgi:RND family efflux transporter MFP subunit
MKTFKIILSILLFTACNLMTCDVKAQTDDEAQLVSTKLAKTEMVKPVMWLPGNVVSRLNASISAEQPGQLLYLVEIGSKVEKGTVIARLDDRNIKLELGQLQAEKRQLEANVAYLKKQQQRMDTLAKNYSTSVSEIDRNSRDLLVAKEQLNGVQLQIQAVELNIEKAEIRAPFSGTVNTHFVSLGELITTSMPVLQLVDTEHLDIQVATPLNMSGFVTQIDEAQVKWSNQLKMLPLRTWSTAGNQESRTFDLRIDASGLDLFAGSAVLVSLPKSEEVTGVAIPRDGLILREKESYVFTVDKDLVAHKINVQIGQGVDDWVMISGNIKAGDQIIVRGGERLEDGQQVRINSTVAEVSKADILNLSADAG